MWKDQKFEPSESRNYVAVCYKDDYKGHYFRQFYLPECGGEEGSAELYENTCAKATWYFTTKLFPNATVECCIPLEQYLDCKDQDELNKRHKLEMERLFPKKTVQLNMRKRK